MNTSILDKPIVLALNAAWQIIGHRTVREAIVALTGGDRANPPALGLDIAYSELENGQGFNFDRPLYLNPIKWEEWEKLPIREFDFSLNTSRQQIRVPTVIVAANFSRMPMTEPRVSREAIFNRDGGVCQYTGEYIGRNGNLDHVIPRDKGGKNTFENLVWSKPEVNSRKAARLPHEAGLKLIRNPTAPKKIPISSTIRTARHPDWHHFIH